MKDIELVIKIPEELYNLICLSDNNAIADWVSKEAMIYAIKNGVLLPKEHGKLIDISELLTVTDIRTDGSEFSYVSYDDIENAPAIV